MLPNAAGTQPYTGIVRNRIDSPPSFPTSFSDFSPLIFASDSFVARENQTYFRVARSLHGHDLHHRLLIGGNARNEDARGSVHDPRTHGVRSTAGIRPFVRIEVNFAFLQVGADFRSQRIIWMTRQRQTYTSHL